MRVQVDPKSLFRQGRFKQELIKASDDLRRLIVGII